VAEAECEDEKRGMTMARKIVQCEDCGEERDLAGNGRKSRQANHRKVTR
jgi:hypothetical protein